MAPVHLRGFNVADVQKKEYVCPGEMAWLPAPPVLPLAPWELPSAVNTCPAQSLVWGI